MIEQPPARLLERLPTVLAHKRGHPTFPCPARGDLRPEVAEDGIRHARVVGDEPVNRGDRRALRVELKLPDTQALLKDLGQTAGARPWDSASHVDHVPAYDGEPHPLALDEDG